MLRHALTVTAILAAFPVHAKTPGEVYEQAAKSTVVVLNMDGKGKTHEPG
jgi:predicted aconitase with swiveling domain